jgi:hypothetical protein
MILSQVSRLICIQKQVYYLRHEINILLVDSYVGGDEKRHRSDGWVGNRHGMELVNR